MRVWALILGAILLFAAARRLCADQPTTRPSPVTRVGTIVDPAIPESSGLIASRRHPGLFWTHNDSGNPAFIFAIDREGKTLARVPIDATNVDWEDIAIDEAGHIYIADIGNNDAKRKTVTVYRVNEPDPKDAVADRRPQPLPIERKWTLCYPGRPFDAEAFFTFKDHGYLISKRLTFEPAGLYRFPLDANAATRPDAPIVLEHLADLPIRVPVTAADISADGRSLAVMSVAGLYLFSIDGKPEEAKQRDPDFVRYIDPTMEACCFVPDGILATTEKRDILLFLDPRKAIAPTTTTTRGKPVQPDSSR